MTHFDKAFKAILLFCFIKISLSLSLLSIQIAMQETSTYHFSLMTIVNKYGNFLLNKRYAKAYFFIQKN